MHKIFDMPFARVYPLYVTKVEKKGRSQAELDEVIGWFTGFDKPALMTQIDQAKTFTEFFEAAKIHPNASLITGAICNVRVEDIEDPLMQKIRYLDKLVDELAKGRPLAKILRS